MLTNNFVKFTVELKKSQGLSSAGKNPTVKKQTNHAETQNVIGVGVRVDSHYVTAISYLSVWMTLKY